MAQVIISFFGSFFLYVMMYKTAPNGRLGVFSLVFWGYGMSLVSFLDYMGVESRIHSTIFLCMSIISAILFFVGIRISYIRGTDRHRETLKTGARDYGKFLLFGVGIVLVIVILNELGYFY